jgi:hypothetical protein
MNSKNSLPLKNIFIVLFPILALLGWLAMIEFRAQSGTAIRVHVEGYDPRDLLTGHFLRFRIPSPKPALADKSLEENDAACLCFPAQRPDLPTGATQLLPCSLSEVGNSSACPLFLRGSYNEYSGFQSSIERYSIPERFAPVLATAPAESNILLSLTADGRGTVLGFFVGDERLEVYAERKLAELREVGKGGE